MHEKNYKRYTITSALPYANGPIHIGHLAGVYVPADIYARYLRSNRQDVLFIGGSDEHGVPIMIKALKEGVTPQDIVDKFHDIIKKSFSDFGISFDVYSRTSSEVHHATASDFFKKLYDEGKFIEQTTEQYYDEQAQQFLADRYIIGTCPKCGYEEAYGDQCEKCGTSHNATDLINPKSTLSGAKLVRKPTKHWYLPLNDYEDFLKEWILVENKTNWKTNVYGQCKSWLDSGLQPRAVTRDLDWGVSLPLPDTKGKVLYVWFDAPIGYISASKEWAEQNNKDWKPYWKSNDTKLVHFIGKDNIVFHCIIFPAMLKAEGSYILPENVPANEFLNLEGNKISTSKNWAVWLHEYLVEFPDQQDVLRYVLTTNAPETKDNDFTWKDFQTKNNSELVAIFGNFVNRTISLTNKYFDGKVKPIGNLTSIDEEVIKELQKYPSTIGESLDKFRFREALAELMNLARLGNKYLTDTEPWKVFKTDPKRVETILNISIQICANMAILCEPFLPFTSAKLFKLLKIEKLLWNDAGSHNIVKDEHLVGEAELLFSKIEDEAIDFQIDKLNKTLQENTEKNKKIEVKENINFDDFVKMNLVVGSIVEAEKVAKTDKLLKLTIDLGSEKRVIVSGIAQHFNPADIINKQVVVLENLQPKMFKGIESKGMVLMAEDNEGKLHFVSPSSVIDNGSTVK
ncbi:MAG: methionine--tRNA ligase [Lentimicrobiaceae bacterium]|nr:methionine--tRNA ligase [Lentimicrobiaceae bacterium]